MMIGYQFRPSRFQRETLFELCEKSLVCPGQRFVAFAEIYKVRLYTVRGGGGVQRCVIWPKHGHAIVLVSNHFISIGNFEDRSKAFNVFVTALIQRVAAANAEAIFVNGMPGALWGLWALGLSATAFVLPLNIAIILVDVFGDGTAASVTIAATVLATIGACLFYFLRALARDWPRRFIPKPINEPAQLA